MALSAQALPALRGGLLALLAAALFGVSTPMVQQLGTGLGAFSTAALLYAGALLLAGGMVLVLDQGPAGGAQLWGLLAVLLATAAWGVDNTLSRAFAERDPRQVVMVKALLGVSATALLAVVLGEPLPSAGAVFAVALGDRSVSGMMALGSALMLAGVVLHLAETHGHEHAHEELEHAHRPDDGHHNHVHGLTPTGQHNHRHWHAPLRHRHAHVPDAHHGHRH